MEISTINSSSGGYYNTLSSPFIIKKVSINSYTPNEQPQVAQTTFSRNYFNAKNQAHLKFNINSAVKGYQSPNNIIENSISAGCSPMEAVQIYKAQRAYGLSNIGLTNGVTRMSIGCYTV